MDTPTTASRRRPWIVDTDSSSDEIDDVQEDNNPFYVEAGADSIPPLFRVTDIQQLRYEYVLRDIVTDRSEAFAAYISETIVPICEQGGLGRLVYEACIPAEGQCLSILLDAVKNEDTIAQLLQEDISTYISFACMRNLHSLRVVASYADDLVHQCNTVQDISTHPIFVAHIYGRMDCFNWLAGRGIQIPIRQLRSIISQYPDFPHLTSLVEALQYE
jgi:hypothetical protein